MIRTLILSVLWVLRMTCMGCAQQTEDVEESIRRKLESAAAIEPNCAERIASTEVGGRLDEKDQSLTWLVAMSLLSPLRGLADLPGPEDYSPSPQELVFGVKSVLGEKYVKRLTCHWDGKDRANGAVDVAIPYVGRGTIEYKAERRKGGWTITEFVLPDLGGRVTLQGNGTWKASVRWGMTEDVNLQEGPYVCMYCAEDVKGGADGTVPAIHLKRGEPFPRCKKKHDGIWIYVGR